MKTYTIKSTTDHGINVFTDDIDAVNPAQAFGKALALHPGAKLVSGFTEGKIPGGGWGQISYDPPSTVHVEKAEPVSQQQMEMKI